MNCLASASFVAYLGSCFLLMKSLLFIYYFLCDYRIRIIDSDLGENYVMVFIKASAFETFVAVVILCREKGL